LAYGSSHLERLAACSSIAADRLVACCCPAGEDECRDY
jgi:hypothetical protein